jgi:hypothetical protein
MLLSTLRGWTAKVKKKKKKQNQRTGLLNSERNYQGMLDMLVMKGLPFALHSWTVVATILSFMVVRYVAHMHHTMIMSSQQWNLGRWCQRSELH